MMDPDEQLDLDCIFVVMVVVIVFDRFYKRALYIKNELLEQE